MLQITLTIGFVKYAVCDQKVNLHLGLEETFCIWNCEICTLFKFIPKDRATKTLYIDIFN